MWYWLIYSITAYFQTWRIFTMTTTESKEEISDTDSGIILHSGKNVLKLFWNMAQLGPYRKKITYAVRTRRKGHCSSASVAHSLFMSCRSAVKEKNVLIYRGGNKKKMKYKCKLGHWTCDTKDIYPEMFCQIFTLHCVLFTAMKVWRLVFTATFSPKPP